MREPKMKQWYEDKIEAHRMMAAMNIQNGVSHWMHHVREMNNYKAMLDSCKHL